MLRLSPAQFATLAEQMRGVRTIGVWGQLATYLGEGPEEEGGEQGAISGADVATVAAWGTGARRYVPADNVTLARVRAEREAVQERCSDLGRLMTARSLWRGGMLAGDYDAVRAWVADRLSLPSEAGVGPEPHPARPSVAAHQEEQVRALNAELREGDQDQDPLGGRGAAGGDDRTHGLNS